MLFYVNVNVNVMGSVMEKESTEANRKKNQKILRCPEYFQIENI